MIVYQLVSHHLESKNLNTLFFLQLSKTSFKDKIMKYKMDNTSNISNHIILQI